MGNGGAEIPWEVAQNGHFSLKNGHFEHFEVPPLIFSCFFNQNNLKQKSYIVNCILATTFRKDIFFQHHLGGVIALNLVADRTKTPQNILVQKSFFYKSCSLGSF